MLIEQRNTAVQSYYSIIDSLPERRREVFYALRSLGKACNMDIAEYLNLPINRVTPRVNELVKIGVVVESHRAINPKTDKRVIYWKVKEREERIIQPELL